MSDKTTGNGQTNGPPVAAVDEYVAIRLNLRQTSDQLGRARAALARRYGETSVLAQRAGQVRSDVDALRALMGSRQAADTIAARQRAEAAWDDARRQTQGGAMLMGNATPAEHAALRRLTVPKHDPAYGANREAWIQQHVDEQAAARRPAGGI